jgi:MFS transporter, AAHS family, cis,cis-muconate transporter
METNIGLWKPSTTSATLWVAVFAFAFLVMVADGADLMFLSYSLPSLKREFALTSIQLGSLGSLTLAGMALGGIAGGWASDRLGRVRIAAWTTTLFSVGTMALGMTRNFEQFASIRFLSSMGIGAAYVVCNTLLAEYVPTQRRTTVLGALQAGWSVGYVSATLLARWILPDYGWRWLFYIAVVPVVVALVMRRMIDEPQSWTAARDERQRAGVASKSVRARPAGIAATIFRDRMRRKIFLSWTLTAGALQFGYYGVNNWLPTFLQEELKVRFTTMTGFMVCTYVSMILGKVIAGWLADHFGRRRVFALGALGAAAFLPVIVLHASTANIAWLLMAFGFVYGVPYGVNATYMTESFETSVRGSAVSGAYNVGRIGAAVAPVAIGYLATSGSIGEGFLVTGAAYFVAGVVPLLLIPEKLHDPLQ